MFSSWYAALLTALLWVMPSATMLYAEELPLAAVPIPGMFNLRDGQVHDGMLWEALQLLAVRLPDLQLRYEVLPMGRVDKRIRHNSRLCSSGQLQSPERDKAGYFVPHVAGMPIHVVVRREAWTQLLLAEGQVSLDWLLANPYLRGSLAKGRVYPQPIRQSLIKALGEGRIAELGGSMGGENLLLMVSNNRLDYVFDYPLIHSEFVRQSKLTGDLLSIPLSEHAGLEILGFYCPRTPWGARMAASLDQAIRAESANPATVLELYQRWLQPDVFARYRTQLLQFFSQRANSPLMVFD